MNRKILRVSGIFAITSILTAILAVIIVNWCYPKQTVGKLVFEQTYNNGLELNQIQISSANQTINLFNENNFWVVREADDYYANIDLLNRLLTDINSSSFYTELKNKVGIDDKNSYKIKTFSDEMLLDEVMIGEVAENENYRFVKKKDGKVWLADGNFELSDEPFSWIMQPILELPAEIVESVEFDDFKVKRENQYQLFTNDKNKIFEIRQLLQTLSYVNAENVKNYRNFDENEFKYQKTLKITTFQGLIEEIDIYRKEKEYWIKINLSTTPLPKKMVNDYIKDNNIFYEGWYFKVSGLIGNILSSPRLF